MFHCNVILIMIIIILIKRTTHQANLNYTKDVSEQFGSFIISKIQVLNTVLVNVKALRCLHLLRSSVIYIYIYIYIFQTKRNTQIGGHTIRFMICRKQYQSSVPNKNNEF